MKIILIDSNSYIYRFYHALKGLSTSGGFPTNAIYGFTGMLLKLIKESKAEGIAAVFDTAHPTERHIAYVEYKANRPSMPEDLSVQFPVIREIIGFLGIEIFESAGYEADDLIGTIAKRASEKDCEVYIMSNDKDMLQLVNEKVKVYDLQKDVLIGKQQVIERFGVEPSKIPDIMALTGDSIDNIPGVKGIGEKKAKELIVEAGSIENLLENIHTIRNDRIRRLISESGEIVRLSKRLALINTDVPFDGDVKSLLLKEPSWEDLRRIFREYELRAYLKFIPTKEHTKGQKIQIINDRDSFIAFMEGY